MHTYDSFEEIKLNLRTNLAKNYKNYLPYIAIFIAIIGWGLSGSFVDFGLESISALPFLFLRFLITTILFLPYLLVTDKNLIGDLFRSKWVWFIGFFETLGLSFQYLGQETVQAGLAILLTLLFVIIVPILSYKFLNEEFSIQQALGTIIALIGVIFIVSNGEIFKIFGNINLGVIILLGSALFYALYLVTSSKYSTTINPQINPISLFFVLTVIVTIFSGLFSGVLNGVEFINFDSNTIPWILLLAIFSTIIPFITYFYAIKHLPANLVSLLLLTQVVVPISIDSFILRIQYSQAVIFGSFLIIAAMIVVLINRKQVKEN